MDLWEGVSVLRPSDLSECRYYAATFHRSYTVRVSQNRILYTHRIQLYVCMVISLPKTACVHHILYECMVLANEIDCVHYERLDECNTALP